MHVFCLFPDTNITDSTSLCLVLLQFEEAVIQVIVLVL